MLDIKFIRENDALIRKAMADKKFPMDLDALLALDDKLKTVQIELESLQAERNQASKQIPKADPASRQALIDRVSEIKPKMESLSEQLRNLRAQHHEQMLLVPAPPRDDVPVGTDDTENIELRRVGEPPNFDSPPKDHVALGLAHGLLDIERGVKLAGSRSYVLTGLGARLEQALLRFTFDFLCERGYTPLSVPVLVKEEAMEGTGYFPLGRDQAYLAERDNMALVGTSEVSVASFHREEILPAESLPIRYMAQSACFRREAGTYGKDTHGLYRVHQFQKVEQVIIAPADPSLSEALHEELLGNAEAIMQALEIPYRVVYVCTGDLGQGQVRKHDIEAWMPSRQAFAETHSCSTFHDFQARRLKIRYKGDDGKNHYCYTLNNTAIATPRVLIPLLECHQRPDGSIGIPLALRPYMGGASQIGP